MDLARDSSPQRIIAVLLVTGAGAIVAFGALALRLSDHPKIFVPAPIVIPIERPMATPVPPVESALVAGVQQPAPARRARLKRATPKPSSAADSLSRDLERCKNDPDPLCGL